MENFIDLMGNVTYDQHQIDSRFVNYRRVEYSDTKNDHINQLI